VAFGERRGSVTVGSIAERSGSSVTGSRSSTSTMRLIVVPPSGSPAAATVRSPILTRTSRPSATGNSARTRVAFSRSISSASSTFGRTVTGVSAPTSRSESATATRRSPASRSAATNARSAIPNPRTARG